MSVTITTPRWLDERDDRASLVGWLTVAAARLGGPFLDEAFVTLLRTGRLSDSTERAVRRARARTVLLADRHSPDRVGRKAVAV